MLTDKHNSGLNPNEFPERLKKCPRCGSENLLVNPIGNPRTEHWICAVYCKECGRTFTEDGKEIKPDETSWEDLR